MSQRALKKRDQLHSQRQEKEQHQLIRQQQVDGNGNVDEQPSSVRRFGSTPNLLETNENPLQSTFKMVESPSFGMNASRSESDLNQGHDESQMVNAKSEFHLKSIASARVDANGNHKKKTGFCEGGPSSAKATRNQTSTGSVPSTCSVTSITSADRIHGNGSPCAGFADPTKLRVPIVGYEVMEERARFTVYKLRVENPFSNDCWLVLRRYTDFQRLNNKLKGLFPHLAFTLPRKKIFGDNFSAVFLANRVQGLQAFINAVMANEQLRSAQVVRDFFCLDEPPTYSESMEECRAIFEAQEETISHLKLKLRAKDDIIRTLQQQLNSEIDKNEMLSAAIK